MGVLGRGGMERTFMRRVTVSAKVGMDCFGSLMVRRCSMPSSPYQLRSLMNPVPSVVLCNAIPLSRMAP